jgi:hypothetical protein
LRGWIAVQTRTVYMIWRRHDPHPSTHAAVALLTELYRRSS